jgi:hypothetical protein
MEEDRANVVLDQLPFDVPYQPPPLLARPLNREKKKDGARLAAAPVMSEERGKATHMLGSAEPSRPPPVPAERPAVALRREHGIGDGARLSQTELAALIARQDAGLATTTDWRTYERWVEAKIGVR